MTITIGYWIIPTLITLLCAVMMLRPYESSGSYDFGAIFRVAWVIPTLITWIVYLGVLVAID